MIKTTNLLIVFTIALLMLSCGKTDKKQEVIEEKKEELAIEVDTATSYETEAIKLSEPRTPNQTDSGITSNEAATNHRRTIFSDRRINISVTGLDGRIGYLSNITDANHVLSILIDAIEIEISSIPRDTYCDFGIEIVKDYDKNKLTYCRPLASRERYQQELARIAKLDTIHCYIEFGFSQAIGIIEFLGYKEPGNTLQVLRNRKALGGDDYQRCYSQGQFIRQALLKHFNKFTGITGGLLASAGLALVETNFSGDKATWKLEKAGFPKTQEVVRIHVWLTKKIHYKDFDFGEEKNIEELVSQIEGCRNQKIPILCNRLYAKQVNVFQKQKRNSG